MRCLRTCKLFNATLRLHLFTLITTTITVLTLTVLQGLSLLLPLLSPFSLPSLFKYYHRSHYYRSSTAVTVLSITVLQPPSSNHHRCYSTTTAHSFYSLKILYQQLNILLGEQVLFYYVSCQHGRKANS